MSLLSASRAVSRALLAGAALLLAAPHVAAETLKLCVEDADVRPWRTRDGQGLNYLLLNRAAKLAGVEFRHETMTWSRCLVLLKSGGVDGAFAASFKQDRLEIGAYPGGATPDEKKRLHMDRYMLVRKRGTPVDWDGRKFLRLEGPVGTQLGYSINDTLKKMGVATDDGSQSGEALLKKLRSGRIMAAAMLEGEVQSILSGHNDYASSLEILPTPLEEKPYFLMLSHARVKKNPQQAQRIWNAIEQVRQSRDYQRAEKTALAGAGH